MKYQCPDCKKYVYLLDESLNLPKQTKMSSKKQAELGKLGCLLPYQSAAETYAQLRKSTASPMGVHRSVQILGVQVPETKAVENATHAGVDGTMICIREEGWKEAQVGAVYKLNQAGRATEIRYASQVGARNKVGLETYQLAGSPSMEETGKMALLGDGAAWIDEIHAEHFSQSERIVDFWHASEYVWEVARAFYGQGTQAAKVWAGIRIKLLKKGKQASLKNSLVHLQAKTAEQKKARTAALRYFKNHGHQMNYPKYKRLGFHIGSGVIESGCKHVVQSRMKRSGMRWSRSGAENLLRLRTYHLNLN